MHNDVSIEVAHEAAARQVLQSLVILDRWGEIELHAATLLCKRDDGAVDVVDIRQPRPLAIDFVDEVGERLEPGRYALVASVREDGRAAVDRAAARAGATVQRRASDDLLVDEMRGELREIQASLEQLDAVIAGSH